MECIAAVPCGSSDAAWTSKNPYYTDQEPGTPTYSMFPEKLSLNASRLGQKSTAMKGHK